MNLRENRQQFLPMRQLAPMTRVSRWTTGPVDVCAGHFQDAFCTL